MKEYRVAATNTSPEIVFDPGGIFRISGRSIHENMSAFYKPAEDWLDEYINDPADITCLEINLEYFNSASSKLLVRLMQKISGVELRKKKFIVNWYYEDGDEDILERGEYFSSVLKKPFNFIKSSGSWHG
ncbi:MAG TPA: DUF1987 domain-containing protein [Bacteroidales bacterium]|jgi:hypothetical protein|nr:DUF1987 domain-containing protein [Bacteroidales bacterium]HNR41395.1 DUF1987 domain-containing protein [Bacteroidales bacterium]HPM17955.1 DUF1987 domain-containing protein [Bacteroidales bacterium]HQG76213.1 DUF1987 domain-containing protein [Bacteroidales bacterium]